MKIRIFLRKMKAVCFHLFFILFTCNFSYASTDKALVLGDAFYVNIHLSAHQVSYFEKDNGIKLNEEKGVLLGRMIYFGYENSSHSFGFSYDKSSGELDYFGRTQLNKLRATKTDIAQSLISLEYKYKLPTQKIFSSNFDGSFQFKMELSHQETSRNINSLGAISGLNEDYTFDIASLGALYKIDFNSNYLLTFSADYQKSFDGNLEVFFINSKNTGEVPLKSFYQYQLGVLFNRKISNKLLTGLGLEYLSTKLNKSETALLYNGEQLTGAFFQPERRQNIYTIYGNLFYRF